MKVKSRERETPPSSRIRGLDRNWNNRINYRSTGRLMQQCRKRQQQQEEESELHSIAKLHWTFWERKREEIILRKGQFVVLIRRLCATWRGQCQLPDNAFNVYWLIICDSINVLTIMIGHVQYLRFQPDTRRRDNTCEPHSSLTYTSRRVQCLCTDDYLFGLNQTAERNKVGH